MKAKIDPLSFVFKRTRVGWMALAAREKKVCFLAFGRSKKDLLFELQEEFPHHQIKRSRLKDDFTEQTISKVISILDGRRARSSILINMAGSDFQLRVWSRLCEIPWGETRTYSEIANDLGNPKAVRAVARACAMNRIALLIPCHRVIAQNGRLAGYRWGIAVKEQLLRIENQALAI
jgi:AraC family transcriptional regulator of adaptative response/methylated-DNA-[protein]-cysteine methyltransferase